MFASEIKHGRLWGLIHGKLTVRKQRCWNKLSSAFSLKPWLIICNLCLCVRACMHTCVVRMEEKKLLDILDIWGKAKQLGFCSPPTIYLFCWSWLTGFSIMASCCPPRPSVPTGGDIIMRGYALYCLQIKSSDYPRFGLLLITYVYTNPNFIHLKGWPFP